MKILALAFLTLFVLAMTGCTTVSESKVGGKDVVQVTKIGIQFFNSGGAPVQECVTELGSEGATRVIEANGPSDQGLFGMTRSFGTTGLDICNAVGEK